MSIDTEKKARPAFEIVCRHEIKEHLEKVEMAEEQRLMDTIDSHRLLENTL